ncbi:elongator complex protein 2 [Lycorma delicatula]|uniref:elongator complex protein 2 n=1 Tax=Lycorma delicatula TaxID=130591 RepID=UPI003F515C48
MIVEDSYFRTCYVSCACNATPHVVDWNNNGIICYGASNVVVLYKPQDDGDGGYAITTLSGHKGRVNCTKWVKNCEYGQKVELVSGSSDNTAIVWSSDNDGDYFQTSVLTGHENAITVVDATYRKLNQEVELVILTASVDSTVRIWFRKDAVTCLQVLQIPSNGICLSIAITVFNEIDQDLLLACGYDDSKVTLYSQSPTDSLFAKQASLTGHEDWIRALDFVVNDDDEIMLASASQDSTVRLWRFLSSFIIHDTEILQQERQIIKVGNKNAAAILEGVLAGHEGWIYGLHWHPSVFTDGKRRQPMQLLTSSLDKTLVVWAPEEQSGVWLESARMGEIGGNGVGFYGARFGPDGKTLLVHSFNGGIHMWKRQNEDFWEPGVSITGHFNGVVDLAWEAVYGRYILSVSLDQTTRLHAPWIQNKGTWHEMARPQIHGYDMSCIAVLPNFSFVSGAEEKVIRAFTATKNFLENFERLCCVQKEELHDDGLMKNALGAAVPALGLSNRAVYNVLNQNPEEDKLSREQYSDAYFVPQDLKAPPTDDNLGQNTLWPEVMKLYGHGYEVYTLAATHDGSMIASACKATNSEHAAIILWETVKWQKVQTLISHQLTITQLAFSPDDEHLLSVSRDRCWSLFKKTEEGYSLLTKVDKKSAIHTRIIWTCVWTHDGKYFGTGSRDGKVVIWETTTQKPFTPLELFGSSVTSLAFAPSFLLKQNEYLLSIGLETGEVILYGFTPFIENNWRLCFKIVGDFGHALTVKRLAFRPVLGRAGETAKDKYCSTLQLASCGLDHIVKVYDIFIDRINL